jgi:hypothetical protein
MVSRVKQLGVPETGAGRQCANRSAAECEGETPSRQPAGCRRYDLGAD